VARSALVCTGRWRVRMHGNPCMKYSASRVLRQMIVGVRERQLCCRRARMACAIHIRTSVAKDVLPDYISKVYHSADSWG
jgi:hypothetical protein